MSNLKTHELTCDVLVAGGGPAGVPCALAAARNGAKVILCQDRPVLGGNASSEVRMHIVGANGGMEGVALESEVRESGIIEEIRLEQALNNPQRSPSMLDLNLYDLCRNEPNLTLFLNTTVTEAHTSGSRITQVIAERQSTEDRFEIKAGIFVDCTGDGRLGFEAGAAFIHGREGREVYGESLAPETSDHKTLGSSLLFMAKRHDKPMPFKAPSWARHVKEEDLKLRPYASKGSDLDLDYGYWWAEWGGCLDTIKDNEDIRDELLSIFFGVWDFVKNRSGVDADNWALEWFGFLPGKRESRRFTGLHTLTEQDLMESKPFDDTIAYGGWPIDIHPPEGVDAPEKHPCVQTWVPYLFSIPLSSCITKDFENLMFAGRNISATHVAFASTRVMATCAVVGQGVGTTAAIACETQIPPFKLCKDPILMSRVQQTLLKEDAYLIGIKNNDEKDLARSASISASSEADGTEATQVISGQTRSVHSERSGLTFKSEADTRMPSIHIKAPEDRAFAGTHRWTSDPAKKLPAWLELNWKKSITPKEIILIFDSGLHRLLTLTQSGGYSKRMQWGHAQPEVVRDYRIEAKAGDTWKILHEESGNYQRRRSHLITESIETSTLRVVVTATNGADRAHIVEVRVYE
jgi:hypothetical protein